MTAALLNWCDSSQVEEREEESGQQEQKLQTPVIPGRRDLRSSDEFQRFFATNDIREEMKAFLFSFDGWIMIAISVQTRQEQMSLIHLTAV